VAAGLAQRWHRAQHETIVFQAPFGLRGQLTDQELTQALDAALRYRENPDDTGPIDLRATVALSIRGEDL
jgi:hypothetical protein